MVDLKSVLKRDSYLIEQIKSLVAKEMRNSNLISKYVDSSSNNHSFKQLTNDQYSIYFNDFITELEQRMSQCRQNIEELEFHVRNSSQQQLNPNGTIINSCYRSNQKPIQCVSIHSNKNSKLP